MSYFMTSKIDSPDVFIPASLIVTVSCDSKGQRFTWKEKVTEGIHMKDFVKQIELRFTNTIENVQLTIK